MGILDSLEGISKYLPEIKTPAKKPGLQKKLIWSAVALLLFFAMGNITLWGLKSVGSNVPGELQTILASDMGSLISAGIGPIVLASIILQLIIGSGLIKLDLHSQRGRAQFQGVQKLLAIILCFFEAGVYTLSGWLQPFPELGLFGVGAVVLQVAVGSLILLYLDEIVSKYGIGSGIGLFIAGGVAGSFFWQIFRPPITMTLFGEANPAGATGGIIASFITSLGAGANFLVFLPIVVALIIFVIIVFAEGMHVNIPITMGSKGTGGRFPVKLLYVSNMPVILAAALFANVKMWELMLDKIPIIGDIMRGIGWATTSQYNLFYRIITEGVFAMAPFILQAIVYVIVFTILCIVFGIFWVQMGGQGSEAVAKQLQNSGMYIPGFRRDERIIQKVLERYIPTITILGSIFVALLAAFGDMALGGLASGTGILLTVGIIYRIYEELAREQMIAMHPLLGKLFKG